MPAFKADSRVEQPIGRLLEGRRVLGIIKRVAKGEVLDASKQAGAVLVARGDSRVELSDERRTRIAYRRAGERIGVSVQSSVGVAEETGQLQTCRRARRQLQFRTQRPGLGGVDDGE